MTIKHWLGSEDSYHTYIDALQKAEVRRAEYEARHYNDDDDDDDDDDQYPSIYQLVGDVGVVKISGSLVPGKAGWMRYYGVLGYDDIKNALVKAVSDQKAKSILIHSNSGGGAVNGVQEAQSFITAVAKVKPMNVFSEFCCSAAYWLASAAGHITTTATSINGSIGVIRVATEYSKQMEQNGVGVKVLRAGKYKMLVNPYEPLTPEAEREETAKLEDLYQIFTATVAANRGVGQATVDEFMGQGREFLGRRGLEAGLVDAIGSFEDALTYSKVKGSQFQQNTVNFQGGATRNIAASTAVAHNAATSNQTGTEMHLNQAQLAALAGGASMDDVLAMTSEGATTAPEDTKPATQTQEAKPTEASVTPTTEPQESESSVLAFVKAELAVAQAENFTAKAELKAVTAKAEAAAADVAALSAVVQASVKNLYVTLGKTDDVAAMSATELVSSYTTAMAAVQDKFKAGGVARSTAAATQEKVIQAPTISPRDEAAVKSLFKNNR